MITTMMGVIIVIIMLVLLMIFGLKMTKSIQITWYWCQDKIYNLQHGGKKGQTKSGKDFPTTPPIMPERKRFFLCEVFPFMHLDESSSICSLGTVHLLVDGIKLLTVFEQKIKVHHESCSIFLLKGSTLKDQWLALKYWHALSSWLESLKKFAACKH